MLHHIVLIRWKDDASQQDRERARAALSALPGQISAVTTLTVATDAGLNESNHHLVLVATFADAEAWREYQGHPVHVATVRDYLAPILAERAAIQYTT